MNNLQKNANNYINYLEFMEVKMGRREFYQEEKIKRYVYVFSITLVLSIVVFLTIFVMYNKKMKNEANMALENLGTIEDIVSNDNLTETSMSSDLTVKKASSVKENKVNTNINTGSKNTNKIDKTPVESKVTNTTVTNVGESSSIEENVKKELKFESPVSGEIIKDFAMDNLIYSNTLEEWTTHLGIDIKADKTSIVTASEKGIVESIKNDPRFGLTITISHEDGFKTIYSNLLTSEFVTENEEVEKGQTIGTIGETASFEISDEPHLHFEMYKDEEPVNPTIYLK